MSVKDTLGYLSSATLLQFKEIKDEPNIWYNHNVLH